VFADRVLLGVVGRFVAYFALMVVVIIAVDLLHGWGSVQLATTRVSAGVASGLGIALSQVGTRIDVGNRILAVDLPCTAVFIIALFSALVLAYPVSWRMRLLGLAAGIPVIVVSNIVRIVAAAGVSVGSPGAFDFFHDYLFQVGMVMVTVVVWAAWLSVARRNAR
jgi:exosortase/archaeosortase family protein